MTDALIKQKKRRVSRVWLVPIVALALGAGVVFKSLRDQGPAVDVHFATAEGLKAGETLVKRLSVDIGIVEDVKLDTQGAGVIATLRFDPTAREFLREGTQFWVVRPRIGAGGVSGLSTLLSGGYIELSPGTGAEGARSFVGLDEPPRISQDAMGLGLELVSDFGVSVGPGSPLLYQGLRVGEVEFVELDIGQDQTRVHAFIESPYDKLVGSKTRFWNASGLRLSTGASGLSVETESLEAIIAGGIAFNSPQGSDRGAAVAAGHEFTLHANEKTAREVIYRHHLEYLLLFDSSVRGLEIGAPVEYRGLQTGTVVDFGFDLVPPELRWNSEKHALIPVLIHLEPGRVDADTEEQVEILRGILADGTRNGLRAQLATGSLLTGSLFVKFDYHPSAAPSEIKPLGDYEVLPTIGGGISQLQNQLASVLTKVQEWPVEEMLGSANRAVNSVADLGDTANATVSELRDFIGDPKLQAMPGEVTEVLTALEEMLADFSQDGSAYKGLVATFQSAQGTMDGLSPESEAYGRLIQVLGTLRLTVQDASRLLETLEDRPSRILFSGSRGADPVPGTQR